MSGLYRRSTVEHVFEVARQLPFVFHHVKTARCGLHVNR